MADSLLTALTSATALKGDEAAYIVQSTLDRKTTAAQIALAASRRFSAVDYGAKFDGIKLIDVTVASASTTLSSPSYNFTAADIGKVCVLHDSAGESVATPLAPKFLGTIAGVSGNNAILSGNATFTATANAIFYFGTDDTAAIQACVDAAQPTDLDTGSWTYLSHGVVEFPVGISLITQAIKFRTNTSFIGQGRGKTVVKWVSPTNMGGTSPYYAAFTGLTSNGSSRVNRNNQFRQFTIDMRSAISNVSTYHRKCVEAYYMIHPVFEGMGGLGSPATAFGCDFIMGALVINNYVENPGRLWSSGAGGSSGFDFQTYVAGGWTPSIVSNELDSCIYSGNIIVNPAISGIRTTDNSTNQAIARQVISGNLVLTNKATGKGLEDNAAQGTIITGNTLICTTNQTSADTGVDQESWAGILSTGGRYGIISNNTIIGPWAYGIRGMRFTYSSSTLVTRDYLIANNNIYGAYSDGIRLEVDTTFSTSDVSIQGNRIASVGGAGISVSYKAASGGNVSRIQIAANSIRDCGAVTASDIRKSGILVEVPAARLRVMGNVVDDTGGATAKYGLTVSAVAVTEAFVANNDFSGVATTQINLTGGGTLAGEVRGNKGYHPGPATVTPGASPWAYTAGVTPETLYLSGGTVSLVTKGGLTLATATGTSVQLEPNEAVVVTYSVAPTAIADKH